MSVILLVQWGVVLIAALFALIKGADLFIDGARKIGLYFGMSAFAIGVLIVGMGTSLPELASSLAGALTGATEIVVANAVGSNITNILLIVGLMTFIGGRVAIKQDLLRTELPLFVIATILLVMTIMDGSVDRTEACVLLATFGAYIWYIFVESKSALSEGDEEEVTIASFPIKALLMVVFGLAAVLIGAKFTVDMVVNIATALSVPVGFISITAVAIGTSLPELFVSLKAIKSGQTELAIGNIFGSNTFNALMVVGVPALLVPLTVDAVVMEIGMAMMIAASIIFVMIGLSRQVMRWEGLMMLIFFVFFMVKLAAFL